MPQSGDINRYGWEIIGRLDHEGQALILGARADQVCGGVQNRPG